MTDGGLRVLMMLTALHSLTMHHLKSRIAGCPEVVLQLMLQQGHSRVRWHLPLPSAMLQQMRIHDAASRP